MVMVYLTWLGWLNPSGNGISHMAWVVASHPTQWDLFDRF